MSRAVHPRSSGGCNCRTVVVNARNVVRDTKVETGDAKVVNINVTHVSAGFARRGHDIEIDQEAEAITGDAIAGQVIGVSAPGPGCVNIQIHADNDVEDSKVQSGDATAINKSIVLLDPGVSRGDLEIDVDQEAEARSGRAIAGQVIGAVGGGGPCGRVDVQATNRVVDTKVKTGDALTRNVSAIFRCAVPGCFSESGELLGAIEEVETCSKGRCRRAQGNGAADGFGSVTAGLEEETQEKVDAVLPALLAAAEEGRLCSAGDCRRVLLEELAAELDALTGASEEEEKEDAPSLECRSRPLPKPRAKPVRPPHPQRRTGGPAAEAPPPEARPNPDDPTAGLSEPAAEPTASTAPVDPSQAPPPADVTPSDQQGAAPPEPLPPELQEALDARQQQLAEAIAAQRPLPKQLDHSPRRAPRASPAACTNSSA